MADALEFRSYPCFRFRSDLAEEIGFLDALRAPQPFDVFSSRHSHFSPGALELAYEHNCRVRQMLMLGRFFGVLGHRSPKHGSTLGLFTDGTRTLSVPVDGLFRECAIRANVALGRGADGPYAIIPDETDNGVRFPQGFVFYDNKAGRGYVLPWIEYPKVNWRIRVDD